MKLATIRIDGQSRAAAMAGDGTVLLPHTDVGELLRVGDVHAALSEGVAGPAVTDLDFAPLVTAPHKIICVGHNYRAHIAEMGHEPPSHPNVFSKFASALVGANDDVVLNPIAQQWDWEAELALVIGRPVQNADESSAREAIAGFTVANDVSARDWQRRTSQWLLGKTFDLTNPLGPWLVSPDEVDFAADLSLICTVDGVEKQQTSTADLLFGPVEIVQYLSQVCRLEPGDVVLTGTPSGVGAARRPVESLLPGQLLETTITGLGTCTNRCTTL